MRAMRAEEFTGYEGLKLSYFPKPAVTDGKVLLRMTAVGVTPLDGSCAASSRREIADGKQLGDSLS